MARELRRDMWCEAEHDCLGEEDEEADNVYPVLCVSILYVAMHAIQVFHR